METTNVKDTDSRVAVITGGSGGIGSVVSKRLAADGMAVAVLYAGSSSEAEKVVGSVVESGGTALAVGGDVADADEMAAAFDRVEGELGGIDVVVHTAGIMLLSPARVAGSRRSRPHAPGEHPRCVRGRPAGRTAGAVRAARSSRSPPR